MFILPHKMTSVGNSSTTAVLLIIMMKVFSVLTLSCPSTKYQTGNTCCLRCPAGSRVQADCTEYINTSCVPCGDGTYMDKASGLKQCAHCTYCDPGSGLKEKESCTATSDAVCEPMEGFYCFDYTGVSCVSVHKHRRCQPGQYISQTGTASTDTECSECRNGTFSDGTLKICQPHKPCESLNLRLITPGNVTTDAQCEEQHNNGTNPWIIAGCLLLIVSIVIIVIIVLYFTNNIPSLKRGHKPINTNQHEDVKKETEALSKQPSPAE